MSTRWSERGGHVDWRGPVQAQRRRTDGRGEVRRTAVQSDKQRAALVQRGRDVQPLAARDRGGRLDHARLNLLQQAQIGGRACQQHRHTSS